MLQFTVGVIFYFLANVQKYSSFQRTHFLNKHFSNSWKRITNCELPNYVVVITDHPPKHSFYKAKYTKRMLLPEVIRRKISGYLLSYNGEK